MIYQLVVSFSSCNLQLVSEIVLTSASFCMAPYSMGHTMGSIEDDCIDYQSLCLNIGGNNELKPSGRKLSI